MAHHENQAVVVLESAREVTEERLAELHRRQVELQASLDANAGAIAEHQKVLYDINDMLATIQQ